MKDKETFYFSHDYNSREDDKIKDLLFENGMVGYGIYWAIVEMLYQNANALRTHYPRIAHDLHQTHDAIVKSVIEDFGLFEFSEDGNYFFSNSIKRRLEKRDEKSRKARESAQSRWKKSDNNANALQTESESNAIKESKVKESKGNNILLEKESKEIIENFDSEIIEEEILKHPEPEIKKEKSSGKKEKVSQEVKLSMPDDFLEIWDEWHEYRKAKRFKAYAGPKWEQIAVDKLLELSNRDPDTARLILKSTYENNYQGFFPLKQDFNGKSNSNNANNRNNTSGKNGGKVDGTSEILSGKVRYFEST